MNIFEKGLSQIKNYWFPTATDGPVAQGSNDWRSIKDTKKNLSGYITPVQLQRMRHDIQMWREAIVEAEQAWYPHRVRMQRMFLDTRLNAHVHSCMMRRKNLVLLKDFKLCKDDGLDIPEATKIFKAKWFNDFIDYTLDAKFYGYSLISLGDIENDEFKDISIIRRHNISPDRLNVTSYVYSLSGAQFLDEPYKDWHIWVTTNSNIGISKVGYGLLYEVAQYEIMLRNLLGFNGDAAELYGMPLRVGKTTKTNEDERAAFFNALLQMGSAGSILMDMTDEIEFVETKTGAGWKIYGDLEARCEKKVSKLILGHSDAIDSTPGKLGADQGEESPVRQALMDIQKVDIRFVEEIVNNELIPRMRMFGFLVPEDVHFEFTNDAEREELRKREDASNQMTAQIAYTMKQSGLQMDSKYFEERTGIPTKEVETPAFNPKIQNKLNKIYRVERKGN